MQILDAITHSEWPHLRGLQLADPFYLEQRPIDIVIGVEVYSRILRPDVKHGGVNGPVAQHTSLSWIISGRASPNGDSCPQRCIQPPEEPNVKREPLLTASECDCENHFVTTHSRDHNGRFIERKNTARRPEFGQVYAAFLSEYEPLGHMRVVPEQEPPGTTRYFLPHHGIIRDASGAAKIVSCSTGSTTQRLIHPSTIASTPGQKFNVEKMYRKIRVHDDDQSLQRILWRRDLSRPVREYALTTVTYNLACAPFLALRCMRQLAHDDSSEFPLAREALLRETYVDDLLSGANTVELGREKIRQLRRVLEAGGFILKKWVANCAELLSAEEYRRDPAEERTLSVDT
ncbi:uncharacterized protein LOC143181374 [Calliopsis andreniformis]|uniref:uncharacterized protein LOC143181374 n=1 Tax=Calliopsis andreniformis TaxID=337506 RepID=UPI003FCDC2E7